MAGRMHFLADLDASGKLTRIYRPQTNGKGERFNRTLLDEWAYLRPYTSNNERTAAPADFLHTYNHHEQRCTAACQSGRRSTVPGALRSSRRNGRGTLRLRGIAPLTRLGHHHGSFVACICFDEI